LEIRVKLTFLKKIWACVCSIWHI